MILPRSVASSPSIVLPRPKSVFSVAVGTSLSLATLALSLGCDSVSREYDKARGQIGQLARENGMPEIGDISFDDIANYSPDLHYLDDIERELMSYNSQYPELGEWSRAVHNGSDSFFSSEIYQCPGTTVGNYLNDSLSPPARGGKPDHNVLDDSLDVIGFAEPSRCTPPVR